MKLNSWILVTFIALTASLTSRAGQPTDQVKVTTDKVLGLLTAPNLQGDKKVERRQAIRKEIDRRFNWPTIARGCLGRHWTKRSPAERKEFASLFSRFLEDTYLDKFETYYTDLDKIDYLGEKIIDDYASVRLQITTKKQIAHPVEYRLEKSGAEWQIYDVLIEGVSLVKNYRDQFDEIIARSGYEKLVADLKAKLPADSK